MDKHLANGGKPNWGSAWGAGDIMYANIDGKDGVNSGANTVNDHGDLKIIGNSTPRYNFGLTLDGSWKGLDFSLFIQGVMKRDYMLDGPYFWGANGGMWQSCVFKEHLDYWRPEGDPLGANTNAYYPKPYFSSNKTKNAKRLLAKCSLLPPEECTNRLHSSQSMDQESRHGIGTCLCIRRQLADNLRHQ